MGNSCVSAVQRKGGEPGAVGLGNFLGFCPGLWGRQHLRTAETASTGISSERGPAVPGSKGSAPRWGPRLFPGDSVDPDVRYRAWTP